MSSRDDTIIYAAAPTIGFLTFDAARQARRQQCLPCRSIASTRHKIARLRAILPLAYEADFFIAMLMIRLTRATPLAGPGAAPT